MKEQEIEVIKNTLELLETMEEGLMYIKGKLKELKTEETINVLLDLTNAFASIEGSLNSILPKLEDNSITVRMDKLKNALNVMIKEYENTKGQRAVEIMQFTLEPAFKNWKREVEETLRPTLFPNSRGNVFSDKGKEMNP
ncbi:hypothetical protein Amet_0737 [Alkaliphilus metalliredigens QYMF]|uniref:DUF8042 domain-containing protein n=1 Tax=Alkaliphilus metalliredigens (strain QYMF) TaxID=293826 RepID=A6TL94_ALKMQ|nr:hypothetical protein [Alkaliphilus metalliredigens]ABR46962.1 hypothetical protein Amet_0737 [Alkaliphilus metalliredigens QYMF]